MLSLVLVLRSQLMSDASATVVSNLCEWRVHFIFIFSGYKDENSTNIQIFKSQTQNKETVTQHCAVVGCQGWAQTHHGWHGAVAENRWDPTQRLTHDNKFMKRYHYHLNQPANHKTQADRKKNTDKTNIRKSPQRLSIEGAVRPFCSWTCFVWIRIKPANDIYIK